MWCFFFNDTATTEIYTLSLHDALPIYRQQALLGKGDAALRQVGLQHHGTVAPGHERRRPAGGDRGPRALVQDRSEEHTSEFQSRQYLVCRLLLEKKNTKILSISLQTNP